MHGPAHAHGHSHAHGHGQGAREDNTRRMWQAFAINLAMMV